MRKIIVLSFLTLDGIMQAPGGKDEDISGGFMYGGWTIPYSDEVLREEVKKQMSKKFNLLLGKETYKIWYPYWPRNESNWPGINDVTKYIVSSDATFKLEWSNSHLITGNIVEEIEKLKSQVAPDLHVYGSAKLVQTLLKNDLVDQLWLKIFPITLGVGKRLFNDYLIPLSFNIIDNKISSKGVIIVNYERDAKIQKS